MVLAKGTSVFITRDVVREMRIDFPNFDSNLYHESLPSNTYMIERVINMMEMDGDYNRKRMQMLDGEHLLGDHSFKLAKFILSGKSKPFTARYCIMNDFG